MDKLYVSYSSADIYNDNIQLFIGFACDDNENRYIYPSYDGNFLIIPWFNGCENSSIRETLKYFNNTWEQTN